MGDYNLCVIVLNDHDDFSIFFNGHFAKVLEVMPNNVVKVQPVQMPKCILELNKDEVWFLS